MSDVGKRMPKEYSDQFDKLRQNRYVCGEIQENREHRIFVRCSQLSDV